MTYPRYTYKFQFNNDVDSCVALKGMLEAEWTVCGYSEEDGYRWLWLQYEK